MKPATAGREISPGLSRYQLFGRVEVGPLSPQMSKSENAQFGVVESACSGMAPRLVTRTSHGANRGSRA